MSKKGWHYTLLESKVWASTDRSQVSDRRRRPDPGGGEGLMGRAHQVGAQLITLAVQLHEDRLHLAQVPHQVRPGNLIFSLLQALLQVHLQAQGQEEGHNMAYGRIIPLMIDGPHFQGGFLFPEGLLHPAQALVGLRHFRCGQIAVGGQDELTVQPGVSLYRGFIDADAALGHLEIAGTAPVADDGFGALFLDGLSQLVHDGLPGRSIFLGLHGVAADHVAPPGHLHLLDVQIEVQMNVVLKMRIWAYNQSYVVR
jgi:hypothetical protein